MTYRRMIGQSPSAHLGMIQLTCQLNHRHPVLSRSAVLLRNLSAVHPNSSKSNTIRFISQTIPKKMGISNYASQDGEFRRKDASFRNHVEVGGKYPPEKDRYHLYVSWACPWGIIPPVLHTHQLSAPLLLLFGKEILRG